METRAYQNAPRASDEPRPHTELEGTIGEVREHLLATIESARAISGRVIPATPEKTLAGTVSPIATTYHQKLREVAVLADTLRGIVGELNGRI